MMGWVYESMRAAGARPAHRDADGRALLRPVRGVRLLGWGCLIVALALSPDIVGTEGTCGIVMVVGLACGGLGIALWGHCWVRFDETGLTHFEPWRGRRTVAWANIVSALHSADREQWVLRDDAGRVFRISKMLVGANELRSAIVRHCAHARIGQGLLDAERAAEDAD